LTCTLLPCTLLQPILYRPQEARLKHSLRLCQAAPWPCLLSFWCQLLMNMSVGKASLNLSTSLLSECNLNPWF
jgi:hypothetical protein